MRRKPSKGPNPPKAARVMIVNGHIWHWMLSGLDRVVLWSPTGEKKVVPHYPVTGRSGDDIWRAQRKGCGPGGDQVGSLTPYDIRKVIDSVVAS